MMMRLLPPTLLVLVGLSLFPSGGPDDTHITCWPAYTLSHVGQILNYNGDRVEQSSSLLQVLMLALLHKLTTLDLLTLAKLSSIAFGVATLAVLFALVARVTSRTAALSVAVMAAAAPPLVYWSFSGMETSLVAFTGVCLVLTTADYLAGHPASALWKATLAMGAFALVRPETPLLLACILASAVGVTSLKGTLADPRAHPHSQAENRARLLLLVSVLVCGALFGFRLSYFGDPFPQPVTAKFSGFSVQSVVTGLHYLKGHAWNDSPAAAIVTLTLVFSAAITIVRQVRAPHLNIHVVLPLLFVAGYLAFVVIAGGDWMAGGRFLVHFLPVAMAFVAFARADRSGKTLAAIAAIVVALELTWAVTFARTSSTSLPIWATTTVERADRAQFSWFESRSRINVRDMPLIKNLDDVIAGVSKVKKEPIVIISGQMGMVSYYIAMRHFGRVRFLDRHGLVERALTACVTTRSAAKDTGGLIFPFDRYFENLSEIERMCHLTRPDVVFDIGSFADAGVEKYGYRQVHAQAGTVPSVGTGITGATVRSDAFIAVDAGLVPAIGAASPHVASGR
jgi:hypothetical protein